MLYAVGRGRLFIHCGCLSCQFWCLISPSRVFDVALRKQLFRRGRLRDCLQLGSRLGAQEETSPLRICAPLRLRACPAPCTLFILRAETHTTNTALASRNRSI